MNEEEMKPIHVPLYLSMRLDISNINLGIIISNIKLS